MIGGLTTFLCTSQETYYRHFLAVFFPSFNPETIRDIAWGNFYFHPPPGPPRDLRQKLNLPGRRQIFLQKHIVREKLLTPGEIKI